VDFGLTNEQQQLADAERSWLDSRDPIARVRQTLDRAPVTIDPDAVRHATESGLLALLTPDVGGTHVDLAVLSEAHGHAASSLPIADLAIAVWLLDRAGVPQSGPAADGELLVGLARAPEPLGRRHSTPEPLGRRHSTPEPLGRRHSTPEPLGRRHSAPVPMAADMAGIAVVGESGGAEYLAVIQNPRLVPMTTLDLTRSWARLDLTDHSGDDRLPLPAGTLAAARDALAVHRGLDALGAAARLLEMTVLYAGQRQQFGAPIGSFQAVKHHCANMAVGVEAGRSVLWAGALALDSAESPAERSRAASAAAAYAKAAASEVAGTALQVHGGIGFTWEHDLHLLLRRIKVDEAMDGTVTEHRRGLIAV
jgi:alkylation response protein AidB-like acyl-CoA dehydrogenase